MSTATTPVPAPTGRRSVAKPILWIVLGLAFVSVLIYTDYPLLRPSADPYRAKVIHDRLLLIPHAIAALLALALGPFQFSKRFRQRHVQLHRIMGRVYVGAVAVTAPIALMLGLHGFGRLEAFANSVLSSLWFLCTLCAFLAARNRQIAVHRQWMTRSYIITLNFIFTRVLNPIPAWFNMSDDTFAMMLLFFSVCYLFFSDVYFDWRELTHSRA
jgi:uncharacterized membrane protein